MSSISKITRKDGTKVYKVSYDLPRYNNVRKKSSRTFPPSTPYKEVKAFALQKDREYQMGKELLIENTDITLNELSQIYLNDFLTGLSPSTIINYKRILNNSKPYGLLNVLGSYPIKKLNLTVLQSYINSLSKEGLSPKTIKNTSMLISSILKLAVKLGIITKERNPIDDLILPKKSQRKIEAYTEEEVKEILSKGKGDSNKYIYLLLLIALFTGARRGEISAMKFSKIDFENAIITIDENRLVISGEEIIKSPKTSNGIREIAIPEMLLIELKKAHQDYKIRKFKYGQEFFDSDFIFTNEKGKPYSPSSLSGMYSRFLKRNPQIPNKNFHALRHTYCTILISQNIDLKTTSVLMGHHGIQLTADTYASAYSETKKKAAEKLDNLFNTTRKGA